VETLEQLPVADGLFRWSTDGIDLVGSRCTSCETLYFPKSLSCRNPACDAKHVEDTLFGRAGRLHSYTIQHYQPPPLFRMESFAPYAIGLVEVEEGLRIMGIVTGCPLDELTIDMPVELDVMPLYYNEAGHDVVTYAYRPAAGGDAP